MPSTLVKVAVVLGSLTAAVAPMVAAYTCSTAEDSRVYQLYQAVATDPVCSPYVTSGNSIKWSCDKTPVCTQLMQQLALELPDCFSAADSTNFRSQLTSALYSTCKLCTLDQLQAFSALSKQVSQSSACAPHSDGSAGFSWPCTATGCTAVVKSVAKDVPSCNYAGDNLKARVLNDIEACTGTSVATTKPPSSPSSTSAPSTSASTKLCTGAEKATLRELFGAAANSSNCASTDKSVSATSNSISITAKCASPCFEQSVRPIATSLPDCRTGLSINPKTELLEEIARCDRDTTSSRTAYVSVFVSSSSTAGSSSAGPSPSVSTSAAAPPQPPTCVATGAGLLLAAVLAFPQLLRG